MQMKTNPIINKLDKRLITFINQLTEPYKNEYDVQMFFKILKGEQIQEGRLVYKMRIGSKRRLDFETMCEHLCELPYNEFKVQFRLSSNVFHMMLTLFHNDKNMTEGISYHVDEMMDTGLHENTRVFPNESEGRKTQLLFDEVLLLHKLNRDMRISSELEPTQEIFEIHYKFDKLMETASESEINWAIANELEMEEKLRILKFLNPDRKLQIIKNLEDGNNS